MNTLLLFPTKSWYGLPIFYIWRPIDIRDDSIIFWTNINVESISLILRYTLQYIKKVEVSTNSHICYLTDIPFVCLSNEAAEDIDLKGTQWLRDCLLGLGIKMSNDLKMT